jgi:hypothetical protein
MACIVTANAQQGREKFRPESPKVPALAGYDLSETPGDATITPSPLTTSYPLKNEENTNFINPVPIGQSGNAIGFAFMRTTYLWADDNINSISFMHRMTVPPGSGYLAYDISKDGGLNWENNIQAYNPTLPDGFDARYPQGAIFNPVGNTDPDEAYFHYFAPTLDNSNPGAGVTWGGYGYGVKKLADGSPATQHNQPSDPPYYQYLPSAFTVTQTGEAWMVDQNTMGTTAEFVYQGSLIVGHGIWDVDLNDFIYTFDLLTLPINDADGINDIKIAFAPDGMTGYICVMTNLPQTLPYTSYHPVLFKTTDGGNTWSDPIEVQLGGADGFVEVYNFISDEMLIQFFDPEPVPPRDEIDYYMGYEIDLAVDAWGNPHISGMVCIADNAQGFIYTSEGLIAMFHIWSDDQGATFDAFNLSNLHRFDAEFTASGTTIVQYNRPQVATTQDGMIVFFSWLDTDNPDIENNSQPDIFFREYLPILNTHGESVENVTYLSAAMWLAHFGCMSHYVFSDITNGGLNYECTIPFVYTEMPNLNPLEQVQFYYIPDFVKNYTFDGIKDDMPGSIAVISQNFPNPATTTTHIRINVLKESELSLDIFNITGQLVKTYQLGNYSKGMHEMEFYIGDLDKGIYFYSLNTDNGRITRKMIIQ